MSSTAIAEAKANHIDDVNAESNPTTSSANPAPRSVVLGVGAICLVGFGHVLLTDAGTIARVAFGLLVARLLQLAWTDPAKPSLLPERPIGIGVAVVGLALILRFEPDALLTPGFPFLLLALMGAATLFRTSTASPFLFCASATATLVFVLVKSPFWGGLLFVGTALLMRRSLHSRLRSGTPRTIANRSGSLLLAGLVIGACALSLLWVPSVGFGAQLDRFDDFDVDPGALDLLPPELDRDRSETDSPEESPGEDEDGGPDDSDAPDVEKGESRGGTFETQPDGSVEFVPVSPGDAIPEGTVILEEANGGFGSDDGSGYVTCVDGELIYGEVAPGEDAPSQITPRLRRLVTDRKGDGRVLECGVGGVAIRDLGPDEEVPPGAVEILLDDGRYDDIPRDIPANDEEPAVEEAAVDDDALTPSPLIPPASEQGSDSSSDGGIPNPGVWKIVFVLGLVALGVLLFWRWRRTPWLTHSLWRLDRVGASYGRRLRPDESLQAFAADLPSATGLIASEFAECIDTYLFAGRGTADPTDPPTDVRQHADQLLVAMKEQARLDRVTRSRRWFGTRVQDD